MSDKTRTAARRAEALAALVEGAAREGVAVERAGRVVYVREPRVGFHSFEFEEGVLPILVGTNTRWDHVRHNATEVLSIIFENYCSR